MTVRTRYRFTLYLYQLMNSTKRKTRGGGQGLQSSHSILQPSLVLHNIFKGLDNCQERQLLSDQHLKLLDIGNYQTTNTLMNTQF